MSHHVRRTVPFVLFVLGLLLAVSAVMQAATASPAPGVAIVSMYRVAPGKHLEFLKWMAAREAVAREVGIAPTQWYAHLDGDSWDYVGIAPKTTDAQDDKTDALLQSKGMASGFKGGLELRTLMASHTDTYARGPSSAAALVDAASK